MTEKLDDETERLIGNLKTRARAEADRNYNSRDRTEGTSRLNEAEAALRDRVRELTNKARDEGFIDGQHKLAEIMRPSQ